MEFHKYHRRDRCLFLLGTTGWRPESGETGAGVFLGTAYGAQGGGGGGNKPPGGEEAGNNLSYPAVYTAGLPDAFIWSIPADPILGVHYSYGCDKPETVDIFSYPNTTCSFDDGVTFLSAAECVAPGAPCEGLAVDRIYWQKVVANEWNADTVVLDPIFPVSAAYLDWGDNLESATWSDRSVIRVETQPFAELGILLKGFQMWHVGGHGPTEHWGARATLGDLPYMYESPFAIIHTSNARLNLAKLESGDAACPTPGTGETGNPPALLLDWIADSLHPGEMKWVSTDITAFDDPCKLRDTDYTIELNVGGKWVYGYNLMTKRDVLDCDGFVKAGWWRLTFYTENNEVLLDNVIGPPYGPPVLPPASPTDPNPIIVLAEESETEETMYVPIVDVEHNLTYIDICLQGKAQGGGGGGSGGGSDKPKPVKPAASPAVTESEPAIPAEPKPNAPAAPPAAPGGPAEPGPAEPGPAEPGPAEPVEGGNGMGGADMGGGDNGNKPVDAGGGGKGGR